MRIVLIGPTFPFRGGIAQHTTLLWKFLKKRHEVYFISFKRQYPSFLFPGSTDREPGKIRKFKECSYIIDSLNPATWAYTAESIVSYKPDIIVFIWWVPFFAFCWKFISNIVRKRIGVKTVYVCHNVLPHENGVIWETITKWALRSSQGFTVHSESDKKKLMEICPGKDVEALPIAPHPEPVIKGINNYEARQSLGIPSDKIVFLFFGFVRYYKGLDLLIDALSLIDNESAHLLIAGEFWGKRDFYNTLIKDKGLNKQITIVDRYVSEDEFELFFSAADVVVLPYRDATQSGVPQLAFTMGRPVIVTDVGGLAENVISETHGVVIEPDNVDALAESMREFMAGKIKKDSEFLKNYALDRKNRDWNGMIDAIETLAGK
ncbi:glycosyltransferase [bacterium]|nr:glycosyltransferase [bacterium]